MRIIVTGSRSWKDKKTIFKRLEKLGNHDGPDDPTEITIVHGNAKGADQLAAECAYMLGYVIEPHNADWDRYGKKAGPIRNQEMAKLGADLCIAFWDEQSPGTRNMLALANKYNIPCEITTVNWSVRGV
jgi:YspA, cpYpsA-related SLOG family